MSVTQLKDGRWICRYPKGKNPEKPGSNKSYFGRGLDAEARAIEFNASLGMGLRKVLKSTSFIDLTNNYLDAKKNTLAESTLADIYIRLEKIILPFFGELQAHNITPGRVDAYVTQRRKTVKMTTIRNDLSVVRAILNWSVKRRLIASNNMTGYQMPKRDNAIIRPPNKQEIDAIVASASPHIARAILITYYTGLRPGKIELLSLEWESIDFINKTIMVTSASKGGLPVRMVPLAESILTLLEKWHAEDEKSGIQYVISYRGKKLDSIKKAWAAAKKRAKITRRLRLYDIRHAFITILLEKGADLKSVSELVGHSSPDMTMKVYQHVSNNLKRQAIDLLE